MKLKDFFAKKVRLFNIDSVKAAAFAVALISSFSLIARDPTEPSSAMADKLREKVLSSQDLRICALVVGAEGHGVALVGDNKNNFPVRKGTRFSKIIDGVTVSLEVKDVTPSGVELETGKNGKNMFLQGSFSPLSCPTNMPKEFIRHLEANNIPLDVLLRLIADQSGVNISSSDATAKKMVSIFLRNVTAETAVEEICRTSSLWFRRETSSGVLRVTTMTEYTSNLASFREEKTESFTLLYPNVIEVASVIYGLYPERTLLSIGEEEFEEDDENQLSRRFRRFQMLNENGGSSFLDMEAPETSTTSGSSSGSGMFSYSRGGGVNRLGSQWRFLKDASKLTGLTQSEAKKINNAFKSGNTNDFEKVYGGNTIQAANIFVTLSRKTNMLLVRTSDPKALDDIRDLIKRIDVPTPMVLLEMKILELTVTDDYVASFQYSFNRDSHASGNNPIDRKNNILTGFPGFDPVGAPPAVAGAMSFQIVSDNLAARIQLLQEDGKVRTLATPTILTANNEVSRIFDGHEHPIIKGISGQTVFNENQTVTSPATEFEYKDVGTMLLVTPNINSDRTVTLRVLQENSELTERGAEIPVYSSASLAPVSSAHVDTIHSRSLAGTFVAKDGMTVMAGGLVSEKEKEIYTRTPVLGSIPLLGWLFRGTEKVKERSELIVLIKPHVISTPIEGGKISAELMKKLSAHPAKDGRTSMGIHKKNKKRTVEDDVKNIIKD
ncbi:MAG: type II secretion system protein GspD [Kiritimatiellae bacterium]|nr:type II secretion system protein GspD [Kiritimatiellia bacterium]